jgi:hypothetical protein
MAVEISAASGQTGIKLVMPTVGGTKPHQFKAGDLDRTNPSVSTLKDLALGTSTLHGVGTGIFPQITVPTPNLFIPNPDRSYSVTETNQRVFVMPWPNDFLSVRMMYVAVDPSGHRHFCGSELNPALITAGVSGDPNGAIKGIATAHILTYDVTGSLGITQPDGSDLGWKPSTGPIANLHIFAEPNQPTDSTHAIFAFNQLMSIILHNGTSLFQLHTYTFNDFGDTSRLDRCPDDNRIPGIDLNIDLKNLSELSLSQGGEMANCVSAIINVP